MVPCGITWCDVMRCNAMQCDLSNISAMYDGWRVVCDTWYDVSAHDLVQAALHVVGRRRARPRRPWGAAAGPGSVTISITTIMLNHCYYCYHCLYVRVYTYMCIYIYIYSLLLLPVREAALPRRARRSRLGCSARPPIIITLLVSVIIIIISSSSSSSSNCYYYLIVVLLLSLSLLSLLLLLCPGGSARPPGSSSAP